MDSNTSLARPNIYDYIIKPQLLLSIPRKDARNFQLHAASTMDHIWFSRNQLVHNGTQPVISNSILQVVATSKTHLSAWSDDLASSLWLPHLPGTIKPNFVVALRPDFAVAATVISDSKGNIIKAATKRLSIQDVAAIGEAHAALLAIQTAADCGVYSLILEGDALNVILVIHNPHMFAD